jgi:lathosterol oxidase
VPRAFLARRGQSDGAQQMPFTTLEIAVFLLIAVLGHAMALVWYLAARGKWRICRRTIYDVPISPRQIRRELRSSVHAPMHAVILAAFAFLGFFTSTSLASFAGTLVATFVFAETWHYGTHRAFHLRALHWIHVEHHRSHVNSWLTAISFSFSEKLIFDLGLLGALALLDCIASLNLYGIAAWYAGYLIVNSFSHANFELKSKDYNLSTGQVFTSTTYHSLHHSRYTGNYGLATRVLDRIFRTEWDDYEPLYDRICELRPLSSLRERAVISPQHGRGRQVVAKAEIAAL